MSSPKRKKKRGDKAKTAKAKQESAVLEASPEASTGATDATDEVDTDEDNEDNEDPDVGAQDPLGAGSEVPTPAVSEISELRPGRGGKPSTDVSESAADLDSPEQDQDQDQEQGDPQAAPRQRSRGKTSKPEARSQPEEIASDEQEGEEDEDEDEEAVPESAREAPKTRDQLKRVLESLIFVSDQIITAVQLGRITKTKVAAVREMLAEISIDFEGRGIELVEVNGGYQFRSAAASGPYVRVLVAQKPVRLTRAQLETLALIAYRQPITRPEVDDVRGVDSGSAIKVLLDRELIKILGRKEDAGRPLLYGTTPYFLEFFGMNSMQDLPTLREFTELSDEHRDLFQRKTNEIGDLSAEAEIPVGSGSELDERDDQDEDDRAAQGDQADRDVQAGGLEDDPVSEESERDEHAGGDAATAGPEESVALQSDEPDELEAADTGLYGDELDERAADSAPDVDDNDHDADDADDADDARDADQAHEADHAHDAYDATEDDGVSIDDDGRSPSTTWDSSDTDGSAELSDEPDEPGP